MLLGILFHMRFMKNSPICSHALALGFLVFNLSLIGMAVGYVVNSNWMKFISWTLFSLASGASLAFFILRLNSKRLTQQIAKLETDLETMAQQKDQFLAMLAHELRNPLGAISNAVQVLKCTNLQEHQFVRVREILARQVRHQSRLIDELLDASRLARGKIVLKYEVIDLAFHIRNLINDFSHDGGKNNRHIELEIEQQPIWILGDAIRLTQILSNLLDNAFKFTDSEGNIVIKVQNDIKQKRAVVSIRDNGIGLQPELLRVIFDSFIQGDSSLAHSRGGLGLGLTLSKGLVELHGGEISASSNGLNCGAEFTFWLPLASNLQTVDSTVVTISANVTEQAQQNPTVDLTSKTQRVLIIEDHQDVLESLKALLECYGYIVKVAATGNDGIELARQFNPDIIICDLGLPDIDGYTVAKKIRLESQLKEVRLLALSGYGQEENRRQSRESGFDAHLVKPVDGQELEKLLTMPISELRHWWEQHPNSVQQNHFNKSEHRINL